MLRNTVERPSPGLATRILFVLLAAVVTSGGFAPPTHAASPDRVPPSFFGIDMAISLHGAATWPGFDPGAVRIAIAWSGIERSRGDYDWAVTDSQVTTSEEHGAKPLLVIQNTPKFHGLDSSGSTASPPSLSAYRKFVRALIARYGARADYQVWNEPSVSMFFSGSAAHMARMTKILGRSARKLAPDATVVAPSFPLRGEADDFRVWFRNYWSQTVGKRRVGHFVDVANISAYPMPKEGPEDALTLTRWAQRILKRERFRGPLWATEINYGASGLDPTVRPIPARQQAAFVVQTYVMFANLGTERVYWWQWARHRTVNTHLQKRKGGLTRAGRAFGEVKAWLLDTKPKKCVTTKGVRVCHFRVRGGTHRYVLWSRSGKIRRFEAPQGALTRTSMSGKTRSITSKQTYRVGFAPVMIETDRKWRQPLR